MKFNKYLLALVTCLTMAQHASWAEDIDIYGGATSNASNPNIMVIIDNSNWTRNDQGWPVGKQGESELSALKRIVGELSEDVNFGLMLFTPAIDGGYVRYHLRPMTNTNKTALQELIGDSSCVNGNNSLNGTPNCIYNNFGGSAEKTSFADYSASLFETFKYFGGYTNPLHANDDPVTAATPGTPLSASKYGPFRYAGAPDPKTDRFAFTDFATPTTTTGSRLQYNLTPSSCAKNYVIFIGNGIPNSDTTLSLLSGVGGDTTQIPLPPYLTSTSTTTTSAGTTALCYSSAASVPTSDYPLACATYTSPDNCSVGTLIANTASTTCPTGTASYPVRGDILAQPAVIGASHSITGTSQSGTTFTITATGHRFTAGNTVTISGCPVGSQAARTLNGSQTVLTSTPASNTFTMTGNNQASLCTTGTVVGTDAAVAASTVSLGYSQCASACSTTDFANLCGSGRRYSTCSCGSPTVTGSPTCVSGNKYNINATVTVTKAYIDPIGKAVAPTGSAINYADEWARFLNYTDVSSASGVQNVKTFTIDVYLNKQDPATTALLRSMAKEGDGEYFAAKNENDVVDALRKIISEIQSVNSVFASSSLPVSVNTQGTYLNQVFIGMFRPDSGGKPRWVGNLKQYQFTYADNLLTLADKNKKSVISTTTGFITPCAESFWSSGSGNYWNFSSSLAKGSCVGSNIYSDLPDGDVVEKGGAGERLRGVGPSTNPLLWTTSTNYSTRALKTCGSSCTALLDFNTTNVTPASVGLSTAAERDNLVAWVRGQDLDNENGNLNADSTQFINEMRPSAHGDVVHSQPGVVDFGGTTGVVVFYGSNDGMLHAVNGSKTSTTGGDELWSFIAPETLTRFNRLKNNSPRINLPGVFTTLVPTPVPKDYFFDGSVGVYQANSKVWIFPAMRRGGRAIYAFDVTTPAAPLLKWRKGCFTNSTSDDSNCSADGANTTAWRSIGQTWSKPQIGYLSGYVDANSKPKPILVFGGGYDTCEDVDSQAPCTNPKGANIWFVDADSGAIIRTYSTNYSVPGDIALLKDVSGNITHVYAGDTRGYVYRINVGTWNGTEASTLTTLNTWTALNSTITIAYLSDTNHARKFLSGPSVVEAATYNAVLIGSGDREHPTLSNYPCRNNSTTAGNFVTNAFFMVKDTPSSYPASAILRSDLTDTTSTCAAATKGWYFYLPNSCEQVVNKGTSIAGVTYFGTNQPVTAPTSSCAINLGVARGYAVKIFTGCAIDGTNGVRSTIFTGGGLPPPPISGTVDVDGKLVPFCLGCPIPPCTGPNCPAVPCVPSPLNVCTPPFNPSATRTRTFWYK